MNSQKIVKIRDLVSKHPTEEKIVLNDLINNLIKLQVPLGKLEIHNFKDSVTESIRLISTQEKLLKELKHRLRNEVRQEVLHFNMKNPRKKLKPNLNSLANLQKQEESWDEDDVQQ